ncbi:MAG: hypothetical protein JJ878_16205 [Alphaproteobacteria bacterium]|nr:hypothetical protein [Alphaproteobacteria bacterium]
MDHLDRLCRCLNSMGSAVLPVPFADGAAQIARPLSSLRVLFVDIHLVPAVPPGPQAYDIVTKAIESIVAPECGPYVLISWSTHPTHHQTLMEHLAANLNDAVPPPAASACLNKNRYIGAAGDMAQGVIDAVASVPQAAALLQWCEAAQVASGEVANSILNLVDRTKRFAGGSGQELEKILASIAREGAGTNAGKDLPAAMNEGLGPILTDRLLHSTAGNHQLMSTVWAAATPDVARDPGLAEAERAALNTMCAISVHDIASVEPGTRGAVSTLPTQLLADEGFSSAFGCLPADAVSNFISLKPSEGRVDKNLSKAEKAALRQKLLDDCNFRLVGLSAACDHAWGKVPVKKLLLALEVPATYLGNFDINGHDAMYATPRFLVPALGQPGVLLFNWRYHLAMPGELQDVEVLYRLREPLVSHFGTTYHVHGFRPGIPNF